MSDEIKLILELAKNNAAHDLRLSNELLETVDNLVEDAAKNGWDEQTVKKTAERLINIALQLTDQSSETSSLIAKMVGTTR